MESVFGGLGPATYRSAEAPVVSEVRRGKRGEGYVRRVRITDPLPQTVVVHARAARRKRGDAACLVAVVAVDAIEVTGFGEPSEQFQALLVSLRQLEPLPSAGGTSSCVALLIALLALAHEAASAVLIAQKHCCHGHCDGHGLVLFKAAVLADGHHERWALRAPNERQLLCGLCAGRLLLGKVPLVKQVRRRGWGGVGARWRQCREAVPAR